jgi:phospholipid transport system substrate-binding protein
MPIATLIAILLTVGSVSVALAETHPAVHVVEAMHEIFIETMQNAESLAYEGRYQKLKPAIVSAYDLSFMASKTLGRHWKKLSAEQQQKWQELFENLTVATYAGRFTGYDGEYFETFGQQSAAHETVLVQTKLYVKKTDEVIELNYRLREIEGSWRVVDVYMNGTVSELALRRSDYSATLKRDGFEKLVSSIREKIAKLESTDQETLAAADGL